MSDLRQESPLAGFRSNTAAGEAGSPGVILTERPFLGYVNLRGDAGDATFLAAVEGVLRVALASRSEHHCRRRGRHRLLDGP